ncbi:peptidase S8/S53 domain-containing protein [Haematococcus lacustris]
MSAYTAILLLAGCLAICNGAMNRRVVLSQGELTTFSLGSDGERGRFLREGSEAEAVYLLGLPQSEEEAVLASLNACGAKLLHPIPTDHWLLRSSGACIVSVCTTYPDLTAAPLPDDFKVSLAMAPLRAASVEATIAIQQSGHSDLVVGPLSGAKRMMMAAEDVGVKASLSPSELALPPSLSYVKTRSEGGVTRVLLLALGAKPTDQTAAASWAASLAMELTATLPHAVPACYPIVKAVGTTGAVEVALCLPDVDAAVSWLATQPSVIWVEYVTQKKTTNLLASAQMQTGRVAPPLPDDGGARGYHPLWDAGLDGAGQLVGVVDLGLDMGSCYFWDPAFANFSSDPANLYTDPDTGTRYFHNNAHRKASGLVPYYFGRRDFDASTHGTHISGSIAGSCYGAHPTRQPDHATGQAPAAKLAFFDASNATIGRIDISSDYETSFGVLYRKGVRIINNPWGGDMGSYSYTIEEFLKDTYVWSRQDLLLVFPAGNDAEAPNTQLTGNVLSTALSKNVVAVGATDNYSPVMIGIATLLAANDSMLTIPPRFMSPAQYAVKAKAVNQSGATQSEVVVPLVGWRFPRLTWSSVQNMTLELVLADPLDACTPLVGNYTGKVVLAMLGNCSSNDVGRNFLAAGASAGMLANRAIGMLFAGGAELANSPIPLMGLSGLLGSQLMDMFAKGWKVTLTSYQNPYSNAMYFSSYGATLSSNASVALTQDVRIKPEVMAPGYLLSAYSDGRYTGTMDRCQTLALGGTSMASASATGAATLAMLVASTTNMSSVTSSGLTPYDVRHGFGFMNIGRILPLRGGPATSKLQVVDRAIFNNSGQSHTYSVHAASQRALIITLAYMDWPAFPGVIPTLVNNLDLRVTTPSGAVLWGNDVRGGDRRNNVEKLVIPRPQSGVYFIQVDAPYLFIDARPQPYSLVVQGAINTLRTSRRSASH